MVGPSKILTVSYGTFSCTLEGFDDPFSTMRGIAEYFRDLAADDRYFGAEPPTPDAEMLHRIAEREIHRRVESRVDDTGIVLRQTEEAIPETPKAEPAAAPAAAAVAPLAVAAAAAAPAPEPAQPEAPTESVAEKLARIRAATAKASDAYQDDEYTEENFATAPISAAFDDIEDAEPADEAEEAEKMVTDSAETTETEKEQADVAYAQEATDDGVTPEPEEAVEDQEAVSSMMASLVDTDEETAVAEEEAPEVEDDVLTLSEQDMADDIEEPEDEFVEEMVAEEEASAEAFFAEAAEETDGAEHTEAEVAFDAVVEAEVEAEVEVEAADAAEDEVEAAAEDEAEGETTTHDDAEDLDVSNIVSAFADVDDEEITEEAEAVDEPDDDAIARVVKMRRSDFEAAVESGDLQEVAADDDDFDIEDDDMEVAAKDDGKLPTLSDDDEADLMATLAEVQRETAAESRSEKEGRAILEKGDIEDDAGSVSRILEVTNTEMEDGEGSRRRSAIAHLKAAVAATRADRLLSRKRKDDEEEEINQYREDLAKVVRPRRPVEGSKPKERRLAPLMLVSEQRVDEPEEKPQLNDEGMVVRPRRVTSDDTDQIEDQYEDEDDGENIFRDGESFAEFAAEMGASELPDLLEAAAAYYSFVEGHQHFSRPLIMKAVQTVDPDREYSREDSLRSFGVLLRNGKIRKVKRGQFQIPASTRFNPEARAAGE